MAHADYDGHHIVIQTTYAERDLIRSVPGAQYDGGSAWHVPVSWAACKTLRGVFGDGLVVGPGLIEWATREITERVQPCMELRRAITLEDAGDAVPQRVKEVILRWREDG